MKILSDFDGVMTDQTEEGRHEYQLFRDKLVEAGEADPDAVDELLAVVQSELDANPTAHGWWSKERVSAYADEDLFIRVIGNAVCLDHWAAAGKHGAESLLAALRRNGFETFTAVSDWAYAEMARHTSEGDITPMDPVVGDVIESMLDVGHDVVVVSNSATDRVMELLRTLDLAPKAHDNDASAQFRVRGGARKFTLNDHSHSFELDGFTFDVARPFYRTILEGEVPDVVIGDVFSLDLALPLYLTRTEPEIFGGMTLLLRVREYTPAWSRAIFERDDEQNANLGLLHEFGDLPRTLGFE